MALPKDADNNVATTAAHCGQWSAHSTHFIFQVLGNNPF